MSKERQEEAMVIAKDLKYLDTIIRQPSSEETDDLYQKVIHVDRVTKQPLHAEQWRIIYEAFGKKAGENFETYLREIPSGQTCNRGQWLLEYTSAVLARELGEAEIIAHRQSKIQFAIPGIGHELVGVALQRQLKADDFVSLYYRQESDYLMRGGTVWQLWQMTAQKPDDPSSGGVVLAGHPASAEMNIPPTISSVGAHVLSTVGVAQAFKLRRTREQTNEAWRFGQENSIAVCHIGDASMAQGEVMEALQEMMKQDGYPMLLVVNNNGSGISTDVEEGSIQADPIVAARGYVPYGLNIWEVDGSNVAALYQASYLAVKHVREQYKPAVLLINNIYKRVHSSSDDPSRYKRPTELAEKEALDPIPKLKQYLLEQQIATKEVLEKIDRLAKLKVNRMAEKTFATAEGEPERIYQNVYAPAFIYRPVDMSQFHPWATKEHDLLEKSREEGINYLTEFRTDTQKINLRQAITSTLAQEMKRDDRIIIYGEDVADFSTQTWNAIADYLEQRMDERQAELAKHYSEQDLAEVWENLQRVQEKRGHELEDVEVALLADLLGGKGGVFKTTQFLQILYGRQRVWNSRLAEASIIGTAIGQAMAGYLPIVEIQFDAYWSPAYQQIVDQLSTLRWRSGGQFTAGMVIRIQGMNRLGGVGGIGHGDVILGKLIGIPGIRTVIPADANEAGPLLREAIRLAREHQEPIIYLEPIMELNANIGHLQAETAHIPLGEAQVRQEGKDFLVLTYGNNIPLVEKAQVEWQQQGISATIINLRTLGVQTDWPTIVPFLEKHGKVLIVETERGEGSAGANLSAQIGEHFFSLLDAPLVRVSARNIRTPAGRKNEAYALPQLEDIVKAGTELATY